MNQRPLLSLALALCLITTACGHLGKKTAGREPFDPSVCHDLTFDVYFKPDQVNISAPAKAQIDAMQRAMSGCSIAQISVVGLSDTQKISQARAGAIAAALGGTGIPRDKLRVLARGGIDAADAKDTAALMQRRALVTVEVSPFRDTHMLVANGQ